MPQPPPPLAPPLRYDETTILNGGGRQPLLEGFCNNATELQRGGNNLNKRGMRLVAAEVTRL